MKKKTGIIVGVILVVLALLSYLGYRGYYLLYYNTTSEAMGKYDTAIQNLKIDRVKKTINKEVLKDEEYLSIGDIKMKNIVKDFHASTNPDKTQLGRYTLYDANRKVKAYLNIAKTDTLITRFQSNQESYGTDDKRFQTVDRKQILNDHHITNDIEFFEYMVKQKNTKNNLFTSVKEIKERYALHFMATMSLPDLTSITLLDGNYTGYIFHPDNNFKEINILKNNKRYIFTFYNLEYFTEDVITEFLNTLIIENEK